MRGGARASALSEQKRAAEALRVLLSRGDPSPQSRYIREFHEEFRSYRSRVGLETVLRACLRADIVFVGDYHAVPSCQTFATQVLERLARGARPVALFLEMIFARDQGILDAYAEGRIGAEDLRRRIRYDRDWGYAWEGYGRLLEAARSEGARLIAADAPPRSGLTMVRRRDRHAAAMIVEALAAQPRCRALVVFGESHLASRHLPAAVAAELAAAGLRRSSVTIVQNQDTLYWSAARRGGGVEAVSLGRSRYCVFNASPLAKYESYRQTLLGWAEQEERPDFGPSVYHLIELLVAFLGIDPYRFRTLCRDGRRVPMIDLYPEVAARRDRRVSARRSGELRRRTGRPGVVYRPAENRVDVYAFSLAAAAEAAARFLLASLGGRLGPSARSDGGSHRGPEEEAGARILAEAFVAFAVRFLDPGVPLSVRTGVDRLRRGRSVPLPIVISEACRAAARRPHSPSSQQKASAAGEDLGESIYARAWRRGADLETRAWLLRVARLGGSDSGGFRLVEDLLKEGIWRAGQRRRKMTRNRSRSQDRSRA